MSIAMIDQLNCFCAIMEFVPAGEKPVNLYCRRCGRKFENIFSAGGQLYKVHEEIDLEPATFHDGRIVRDADGKPMYDVGKSYAVSRITGPVEYVCVCKARRKLVGQ
jgi:hypothetical protein